MRSAFLLPAIALASCSSTPTEPIPTTVDPGMMVTQPPPTCATGPLPDHLGGSPGGRLEIALSPPAGATLELRAPEGWRVDARDAAKVIVRLPYSAGGDAMIAVHAVCGAAEASGAIPVHVDAMSWTSVASWEPAAATAPKARQFASLWFDPTDPDRLLVHGGVAGSGPLDDLWAFSRVGVKWDLLTAHSNLPVGESGPIAPIPGQAAGLFIDTLSGWSGSGTAFTLLRLDVGGEGVHLSEVASSGAPEAASEAGAFIYDAHGGRYVSACGITNSELHCRVAIFDPAAGSWSTPIITPDAEGAPSGRYGFAYGYDEPNARLVLFSGGQEPTASNAVNPAEDTWALELGADPVRWSKIPMVGDTPAGRRNSCSAIDPIGHRMFVWGGTPNLMGVVDGLYALDLDRGFESWSRVEVPNAPPARSGCAAVYDAARKQILFGFGNTRTAIYTDLWALSL